MNIAFDMDGVLKRISLANLKLCEVAGDYDAFLIHRYTDGYPLLNPALISLPSDNLFVITNCSSEKSAERKRRWLHHFYGDRLKILPVFESINKWGKAYVDPVARAKLNIIYENDVQVYFDDDPAIIRRMREMHLEDLEDAYMSPHAPYTAFMKWGPWIEEIY